MGFIDDAQHFLELEEEEIARLFCEHIKRHKGNPILERYVRIRLGRIGRIAHRLLISQWIGIFAWDPLTDMEDALLYLFTQEGEEK